MSTLFSSFKCIEMVVLENSNAGCHNKKVLSFQILDLGII